MQVSVNYESTESRRARCGRLWGNGWVSSRFFSVWKYRGLVEILIQHDDAELGADEAQMEAKDMKIT